MGMPIVGPQLLVNDVAIGALHYEEFALCVPDGPGFGATLDPDKLAYHPRRQAA